MCAETSENRVDGLGVPSLSLGPALAHLPSCAWRPGRRVLAGGENEASVPQAKTGAGPQGPRGQPELPWACARSVGRLLSLRGERAEEARQVSEDPLHILSNLP